MCSSCKACANAATIIAHFLSDEGPRFLIAQGAERPRIMDAWFFRQRLVAGTVVTVVQGLVVDWLHVADHAVSPVVGPVDQLRNAGSTAVEFYNARIRRYLTDRGGVVLWAGASALYGVRDHPGDDVG